MERLFWIDLHYACVGIVSVNDTVTIAPPIVKWMVGKKLSEIKPWLLQKKAVVKEIKQ
jgi:hypothetical protein